jgi:hypothetical protein
VLLTRNSLLLSIFSNVSSIHLMVKVKKEVEAIPVTGAKAPTFSRQSSAQGGDISLMCWRPFTSGRFLVLISVRG